MKIRVVDPSAKAPTVCEREIPIGRIGELRIDGDLCGWVQRLSDSTVRYFGVTSTPQTGTRNVSTATYTKFRLLPKGTIVELEA